MLDNAEEVDFLGLEPAAEGNRESGEQAGRQNIAVCLGSILAVCRPRVLKWAPVCSESDVV